MFAEQHRHYPHSRFRLTSAFRTEPPPSKQEKEHATKGLSVFSLSYSWNGLPELVRRFGKEQGIFQATLGVMLNILSLRQEIVGNMDMRELITQVLVDDQGKIRFQNDLYGQAHDLLAMFDDALPGIDPLLQPVYRSEILQARRIFETLVQGLERIDATARGTQLTDQLQFLGFHQEQVEISTSMLSVIPSLRQQIRSASDLEDWTRRPRKRSAWVGPAQVLSVLPPHWAHGAGKTGFVYASECVVFPDTGEIFIRQRAKFGETSPEALMPYLAYGQSQDQEFSSREEMMAFLSLVLQEQYLPPHALLEHLTKLYGGMTKAPILPGAVPGPLAIKPYMEAITRIYQAEWEACAKDPSIAAGAPARLRVLADLMQHQIARNNHTALKKIVDTYCRQLDAQEQGRGFAEIVTGVALKTDPGFAIKVDMSLLDCVAGTPMSLMQSQGMSGMAGFSADLGGFSAYEAIRHYEAHDFTSRHDLVTFCHQYGMDPAIFVENAQELVCRGGCGKARAYMGPCQICPQCNARMNLSDQGMIDLPSGQAASAPGMENSVDQWRRRTMSAGDLFASVATHAVFDLYKIA